MHILILAAFWIQDDGPPDPHSSPYILDFVKVLTSPPFNHSVTCVIPSTQRSWIGKAHLLPPSSHSFKGQQTKPAVNEQITDHLKPSYYDPNTETVHDTIPVPGHSRGTDQYWVLVPGTPATCVQLGLFHHQTLFPHSPPCSAQDFDLVVSGPNHGRNTTAAFALSSGTLGGALEASVCGVRSIALSFAFFTRDEGQELIREASEVGTRVINRLHTDWPQPSQSGEPFTGYVPDLYSINVPLMSGVSGMPIRWTWMLDNKWRSGSLYKSLPVTQNHETAGTKTEDPDEASVHGRSTAPSFKWAPSFADIWKTVEASPEGNDGLVIRTGCTSVTPLRANFEGLWGKEPFTGDLKL
ncbi:MAG: hypothetical protein M1831_006302 [Alyxoria varia]|nr:MAG: hypothetical protein M1831_006302 [Alyxoria varia]